MKRYEETILIDGNQGKIRLMERKPKIRLRTRYREQKGKDVDQKS